MLIYHPAYDSYHTIIRLLKLLKSLGNKQFEVDRIRIYDYYFLFLNDLENITLPHEFTRYKHLVLNNKYNRVQNSRYTFSQLESVQNLAFKALTSYGFIDKELYNNNIIFYSGIEIPSDLLTKLSEAETKYIENILQYFDNISIRELKKRTNLIDYRYELP